MMRRLWVQVHRYVGLFMAGFLVVIGLTGSIIVFNPELNAWLNPPPVVNVRDAPTMSPLRLREIAAEREPRGIFNSVNLHPRRGEAYAAYVEPRVDPKSGEPYLLGFSSVYLDPWTGDEVGRDGSGDSLWPVTSHNVMTLINRLHYQLAVPEMIGTYLFGIVALLWTLDCLVALYLTFPAPHHGGGQRHRSPRAWLQRWWNPSWVIKRRASFFRVNFDIHRAGGLWTWLLLLAFAWSSVGFNLSEQVYTPVMRTVFGMPDVYGNTLPDKSGGPPEPAMGWEAAHETAQRLLAGELQKHDLSLEYEDWFVFLPDKRVFLYAVRTSRDLATEGGGSILIFDEAGHFVSFYIPTGHNAGSTINSWIFALHMAKIGGMPYRLFVVALGIFVAGLSITGVYIWWKKRKARSFHARQSVSGRPQSPA